jgi:hypothetical protein
MTNERGRLRAVGLIAAVAVVVASCSSGSHVSNPASGAVIANSTRGIGSAHVDGVTRGSKFSGQADFTGTGSYHINIAGKGSVSAAELLLVGGRTFGRFATDRAWCEVGAGANASVFNALAVLTSAHLTQIGTSEVRGTPTTRYVYEPSRGKAESFWIDSKNRLRRVRLGADTMEIYDLGVSVPSITAPSRAELSSSTSFCKG